MLKFTEWIRLVSFWKKPASCFMQTTWNNFLLKLLCHISAIERNSNQDFPLPKSFMWYKKRPLYVATIWRMQLLWDGLLRVLPLCAAKDYVAKEGGNKSNKPCHLATQHFCTTSCWCCLYYWAFRYQWTQINLQQKQWTLKTHNCLLYLSNQIRACVGFAISGTRSFLNIHVVH